MTSDCPMLSPEKTEVMLVGSGKHFEELATSVISLCTDSIFLQIVKVHSFIVHVDSSQLLDIQIVTVTRSSLFHIES